MKKLIFLTLLLISQPVLAEWTLIDESNGIRFYIDFKSYKIVDKSKIKVWELNDYSQGVDGIF